jgi:hypothetical protein
MRPRYVKVLTSTGRWEYMRLIFTTRVHSVVRDAAGNRYVTTSRRVTRGED